MDANLTRFHLLLGQADWQRCTPTPANQPLLLEDLEAGADSLTFWDSSRFELTLRPKEFQFVTSQGDRLPQLGSANDYGSSDRRGAARDRFGNWYFISNDRTEIMVFSVGCQQTTHFWGLADMSPTELPTHGLFAPAQPPAAAPVPAAFSGLTVTADHYLIVGTLDPGGLLVFDLHAGGPPRQLCWPAKVPFMPFDIAARAKGGVWILDRAQRCYWALDRHLRVVTRDQIECVLKPQEPDLFQATGGTPPHCTTGKSFPEGINLAGASPLDVFDPVSIEALPDDTVLVLDAGMTGQTSTLLHFYFGERLPDPIIGSGPVEPSSPAESLPAAYDVAFVAGTNASDVSVIGDLYVVARDGNQSFRFIVHQTGDVIWLEATIDYFPMRLFSGMGVVSAGTQVYYDSNGRWVPLVQQDRPQYVETATIVSAIFDGRDPGCVWHRLLLDGCLPANTEVQVWSRAADQEFDVNASGPEWQPEPDPIKRAEGSELPFVTSPTSANAGTFDLLFQNARGRYLQLKLVLSGNGRASPHLRAVRVYYPRFSYLTHYLPAVYRADAGAASFLDRFLANVEGINTGIEDKVAAVQILFDLRSAPNDVLAWLANWFGSALDPAWDEPRQRLLLRHVMQFFQWRGTIHGLQMALHLAFDQTVNAGIFRTPGTTCSASSKAGSKKTCAGGCGNTPDAFRIVEKFMLRRTPPAALGEPDDDVGPKIIDPAGPWDPNMGQTELRRRFQQSVTPNQYAPFDIDAAPTAQESAARSAFAQRELGFEPSEVSEDPQSWRDFLSRNYVTIAALNAAYNTSFDAFESVPTPADKPASDLELADWRAYLPGTVTEPFGVKRTMWQDFLSRRYGSVKNLNTAHGTNWPGFDVVSYFASLPAQTAPLWDWFKFESLVLSSVELAHRFSVLLPFTGQSATTVADRMQQLELARRLVELEKPAHTTFDVKFYWALFRLGDARLGLDTTLGLGGRDPALLSDPVLGQTYLADTKLAPNYPFNVTGRQIVGRDRLN